MELLNDGKKFYKINPDYVLMDSFYPAAKLLKRIRKYRWHWIAKIKSNRLLNGIQVKELFSYNYGQQIGKLSDRIKVKVVKQKDNYWATSDTNLNSANVKSLYKKRQLIEEFFKILKSEFKN